MQYCKRCDVTIRNPQACCPLCKGSLSGEAQEEERMFPLLQQDTARLTLGFRIFTFCCITVALVALTVNYLQGSGLFWSKYVLAGAAGMWILTAAAIAKRRNLLKNFIWQMVLLWGIFLFWDWMSGWQGWSIDYAMPGIWLAALASIAAVVLILRLPASYYLIYLLLLFLGSLVLFGLLVTGTTDWPVLTVICCALSCLMLCALLLFQGRALLEELHKKIHL